MPPKMYELRVYRGRREVDSPNKLLEVLDLTEAERTKDLLRRHLLATAERAGASRGQAHLFHLDVHEIRDGRADNRFAFQFSLPVEA